MAKYNEEEFSNFMCKVGDVTKIIHKLASNDKQLQEIGINEAKNYLGENKQIIDLNNEQIQLKIKENRTLINKKIDEQPENSPESFMRHVEKDAKQRHHDKMVRREKMETFKNRATKAFRRGDYEMALSLYDKAIEQIKDSPMLYRNRALTYIRLGFDEKAIEDLGWALRLDENSLKTHLLLVKIYNGRGDTNKFNESVQKAKKYNPDKNDFIEEYLESLKK